MKNYEIKMDGKEHKFGEATRYTKDGKGRFDLIPGDVIEIPEGVKHWHGADSRSWFQHLTTHVKTGGEESNEWLEEVSEQQYKAAIEQ